MDTPVPDMFFVRWSALADSMPGFVGLIDAVQGMLVGWSVATGEVWATPDDEATVELAWAHVRELGEMCAAWGVQK